MSKFATLAVIAVVLGVSACAKKMEEEVMVVVPEPVTIEPTYTGKYK